MKGRAALAPPGTATPAVVLLMTAAGMVAAAALERGNAPYTANFVTSADEVFGLAVFTVPLFGFYTLVVRPRHRTGWLLLGSGAVMSLSLVSHAAAVRLLLVDPGPHVLGEAAAWLSTSLVTPAIGLLAFVPATLPHGRVESPRMRALTVVAVAALGAATLSQAFAPDTIDGVKHAAIRNPLGIHWLADASERITGAAVVVLAVFSCAAVLEAAVRFWRSREDRSQLRALVLVAFVVVLTTAAIPWTGDPGLVAAFVVAIVGAGVAVAYAARAMRRQERADVVRATLVAEREAERKRMRRDLHDGLGPLLAALRLEIDGLGDPGQTVRARKLVHEAIDEVRRISRDLRPALLDEVGLEDAIRRNAATLAASDGFDVRVEIEGVERPLPNEVEVATLRVVSEALTNVVRHAQATSCSVRVTVEDTVRIEVADDGVGMSDAPPGVGLRSMRERAAELGGSCEIGPGARGGTVVTAVLPLAEETA